MHHQAPGKGQDQVRKVEVIQRGLRQFFQMILQVIGQKSQTAGGQGWQGRLSRQFQGPQQVFQDLERITPANLEAPVPLQTDLFTFAAQHQERVPTHNGIAGAVQVAAAQQQHGVRPLPDGDEQVRQVLDPRRGRKRLNLDI